MIQWIAYFGLLFSLTIQAAWANYPPPPEPFRFVSDYTQTLTPQESYTLEHALQTYSQQTSSQIAVVMIDSTEGEAIAQYAVHLGNRWGIGQKKERNGVLLLIAKRDRKVFIATGYGLEGALPDAVASSIIRHDITPYFKQEQYAAGIAQGLSAIIAATRGEYAPKPITEEEETIDGLALFCLLALIIFILFFANTRESIYISRHIGDIPLKRTEGFGGSRSRGGLSGGRSGGFGGGSFGGGGAGGSW